MKLEKATQPTFYFIGVTTSKSSIMKLFPLWAEALGLHDVVIKGIDIDIHEDPEVYRNVVQFLKDDELSLGALVTTHKIDLYNAAKNLFDELDPYAELFGELSCISKRDGKLIGHAKDHISSGLSMQSFIPDDFWEEYSGEAFIMGAGGSAIAIASNLLEKNNGENVPSKLHVTNRSQPRLASMERIMKSIRDDIPIDYNLATESTSNDLVMENVKPYSLIVNATGLGKDRPGSPLTNNADFPVGSLVWELNYRGDLLFMQQANSQRDTKNLHVEDGWIYFIHGWTQVISEVFNLTIDSEIFNNLEKIATEFNTVKK
ncbi:shikimate dehydrogenase family protein [Alkalihalobacillus sp. CinArs1]|uniref:shikimate dehydrogenase family protein n=1 Tax=Alkalihalobacillus sp. CinArs1 TaxID=2995314 RepID=UPI0022DCE98D|nr:shikimate dehydrogenase [Alkalihalobacillus sp. CinArs1]